MGNIFERMRESFEQSIAHAFEYAIDILPQAALAILIIGIGLLIASLLHYLTGRMLEFFAVDKLVAKTPANRLLKNLGIKRTVSDILALLVFWLCIFVTLIFAADILDLDQISRPLALITRFIPQIILAIILVIFGLLLAKFLEVLVEQTLGQAHIHFAHSFGRAVYFIVLFFVFLLVFEQLGFDLTVVTANVMIVLSALLLVCGVGVVVAARTVLENGLACYQLRSQLNVGDNVRIQETTGRVKAFTFTSVVLDADGQDKVLPAVSFFTHTYSRTQAHGDG